LILVVVNFLILYCSTMPAKQPSICEYGVPSATHCCMSFLIYVKINRSWLFSGEQSSHGEHKAFDYTSRQINGLGVTWSACCSTTGKM
jgi:hypothetical protein